MFLGGEEWSRRIPTHNQSSISTQVVTQIPSNEVEVDLWQQSMQDVLMGCHFTHGIVEAMADDLLLFKSQHLRWWHLIQHGLKPSVRLICTLIQPHIFIVRPYYSNHTLERLNTQLAASNPSLYSQISAQIRQLSKWLALLKVIYQWWSQIGVLSKCFFERDISINEKSGKGFRFEGIQTPKKIAPHAYITHGRIGSWEEIGNRNPLHWKNKASLISLLQEETSVIFLEDIKD